MKLQFIGQGSRQGMTSTANVGRFRLASRHADLRLQISRTRSPPRRAKRMLLHAWLKQSARSAPPPCPAHRPATSGAAPNSRPPPTEDRCPTRRDCSRRCRGRRLWRWRTRGSRRSRASTRARRMDYGGTPCRSRFVLSVYWFSPDESKPKLHNAKIITKNDCFSPPSQCLETM